MTTPCDANETQQSKSTSSSSHGFSTAAYESQPALQQYLSFHYGTAEDIAPLKCIPSDALEFLPRCVHACVQLMSPNQCNRALDLGCAVGRASFELSKAFDKVVGLDYSVQFVEAARKMQQLGSISYNVRVQGVITEPRVAQLPLDARPSHVQFALGDACNLSHSLGTFDAVLASNLLCRLPEPRKFLAEIGSFVRQNGILALISPYSWLEQYTKPAEWLGGISENGSGVPQWSFDVVSELLSNEFELVSRQDMPFIIREHERKYQWGVSDGTFWRRK